MAEDQRQDGRRRAAAIPRGGVGLEARLERAGKELQRERGRRQAAEKRAHHTEEQFRLLVEFSERVILFLSPKRRVLVWNRLAENIFKRPRKLAIGQDFFGLMGASQGWQAERAHFDRLLEGEQDSVQWERFHGRRCVAWTASRVMNEKAKPIGILAIGEDITERKRLERYILQVSERERARIAQELHDGLGQQLVAISFLAESHSRHIRTKLPAEAERALEIRQLLSDALNQTRELARGFYAPEFGQGGLLAALRSLAERGRKLYRIPCSFECNCEAAFPEYDPDQALHLYRIAQEAFRNAVTYAKASEIVICCRKVGDRLLLTVADNGRGLRAGFEKSTGMGLQIIKYHGRLIGAKIEMSETSGGGCTLSCELPLPAGPNLAQ